MKRIPTLDGWRGIAILLVLLTHLQVGFRNRPIGSYSWLNLGSHGVTIFFVLSGYLITTLLLREERIDLRHFYVRRFFRLMPCAWTYLLFLVLITHLTGLHLIGKDLISCLVFLRNYIPPVENNSNALTLHFWSLSIEEQFYLVWPPILAYFGRAWSLRLAVFGIGSCALFRFLEWNHYNQALLATHTEVRCDALLIGCALAILLEKDAARIWLGQHSSWIFRIALPAYMWVVYYYHDQAPTTLSESLLIAAMIASTSTNEKLAASKVLEWKHLKFLGVISYSLYVWQELFLIPHWGIIGPGLLPAVALASWVFLEQPGIRFGRRLLAQPV